MNQKIYREKHFCAGAAVRFSYIKKMSENIVPMQHENLWRDSYTYIHILLNWEDSNMDLAAVTSKGKLWTSFGKDAEYCTD
jgi:uncharacterized membrane protein required for colicin V production